MILENKASRLQGNLSLENLCALVEGNLANSPSITAFEDVQFQAHKVRRGDLFIALSHEGIEEAVFNGAYGVLFDKPTQISDREIAWIKVDSVDNALLRLLRFHILQVSPKVYFCDQVSLKLASQILTSRDFLVLDKPLAQHMNDLYQIQESTIILFCKEMINEQLFINAKPLSRVLQPALTIVEQTLFETSFIYDDTYYERQLLSPFFMPYLESILQFFKEQKISYQIRAFSSIKHFEPVFTNIHFQVKEFGKSDNVLIFESDFELIKEQIEFLKQRANWAKIIYVVPKSKLDQLEAGNNVFAYENISDIVQILKGENYHFALIAEQDSSILESNAFDSSNAQLSLF